MFKREICFPQKIPAVTYTYSFLLPLLAKLCQYWQHNTASSAHSRLCRQLDSSCDATVPNEHNLRPLATNNTVFYKLHGALLFVETAHKVHQSSLQVEQDTKCCVVKM